MLIPKADRKKIHEVLRRNNGKEEEYQFTDVLILTVPLP
jgi:hypothetical protein